MSTLPLLGIVAIQSSVQGDKLSPNDTLTSITAGPLVPGSYRYTFAIDNVSIVDPKNPQTSESNGNVWSLMHVPGVPFMDMKDVPHGAGGLFGDRCVQLRRVRARPDAECVAGRTDIFHAAEK